MTGMEYVWRVRVYKYGWENDGKSYAWRLQPTYTKVFTNKVESLQYAAQLESELSTSYKVEVTKWFGDDE